MIYVVHEIEGGHVVEAFTCEADAKSFLIWEEVEGGLLKGYYTISEVKLT